jgi:hypothetical protein
MKDIVVCCLWRRPEFFKLWIDLIKKADLSGELYYLFCLDSGYDRKHLELISRFPFECGYIEMQPQGFKLGKQSFNVLNGMLTASKRSREFVFYIEEDLFVSRDYFRLMYSIHEKEPDIFCSIGTRCNNSPWKVSDNREAYYLSNRPDYQSWASCFRKDKILEYIMPHFTKEYFTDPVKYCDKYFHDSFIGLKWTEQDGLIRRIVEKTDLKIAYPHVPRAYHAGLYGYNRDQGKYAGMSFDQKLKFISGIVFNKEEMQKRDRYGDSTPIDLNNDFNEMHRIDCTLQ